MSSTFLSIVTTKVVRPSRAKLTWAFILGVTVFWPHSARAGILVSGEAPGVQRSQVPGVATMDFNATAVGLHNSLSTPIGLYTAPEPGLAVIPPDQYGGSSLSGLPEPTATQYMAIGNQSGQFEATIELGELRSYFGFYWTAGDALNQVEFHRAGTMLASYLVADFTPFVSTNPDYYINPNTGADTFGQPWAYLNFMGTSGTTFDKIVFRVLQPGVGFESDNHSVRSDPVVDPPGTVIQELPEVPEPATIALAIIGLALLLLHSKRCAAATLVAVLVGVSHPAHADLLGFWDFNKVNVPAPNVALDQSGQGNHGRINGGAVYTADQGGHTGTAGDLALTLDGVDDDISVLPAMTGAFNSIADHQAVSVAFWQFGVDTPPNSSAFWAEPNRAFQAHVPWSDTNVYFDTGGCCEDTQRLSGPAGNPGLYSGAWNHWVFVKDGGDKRVYVNGSVLLEATEQTAPIPAITALWLGSATGNGSFAVGEYDDFAIWDEGLSDAQVTTLYEDGVRILVPGLPTVTSYAPGDPVGNLTLTADNQIHAAAYLADPATRAPIPGQDPIWDLRQLYSRDLGGGNTVEYEVRLGSTAFEPPFGPAGTTQLGDQSSSPAIGVYVGLGQTSTYRLYVTEPVLGISSFTQATFTGNLVDGHGIPGDIDGNGAVDLTDFGILKDNFGKSGGATVPEPSSFVLAGSCLLGLWFRVLSLRGTRSQIPGGPVGRNAAKLPGRLLAAMLLLLIPAPSLFAQPGIEMDLGVANGKLAGRVVGYDGDVESWSLAKKIQYTIKQRGVAPEPGGLFSTWTNGTLTSDADWGANLANPANFIAAPFLLDKISYGHDTPNGYPVATGITGNRDNYSVQWQGELFIPQGTVNFRDGNDDYAKLVINGETLFEDNASTSWNGALGSGGGVGSFNATKTDATVEGLAGGWYPILFRGAEGSGADSFRLVWDATSKGVTSPDDAAFENANTASNFFTVGSHFFRATDPGIDVTVIIPLGVLNVGFAGYDGLGSTGVNVVIPFNGGGKPIDPFDDVNTTLILTASVGGITYTLEKTASFHGHSGGTGPDIDSNGKVDLTDFRILKDNFGRSAAVEVPSSWLHQGSVDRFVVTVPEPAAWVLAIMGLVGLISACRPRSPAEPPSPGPSAI